MKRGHITSDVAPHKWGCHGDVRSRAEEDTPRGRRHWKRVARRYQRHLAGELRSAAHACFGGNARNAHAIGASSESAQTLCCTDERPL
jgi:hypothetical protein